MIRNSVANPNKETDPTTEVMGSFVNVSIVMPAYNAAGTIADALESVLAQTCPNWEMVVVDDGSSDATGEIAKSFADRDARIRLARQPNAGESAARNAGIRLAHYDWLLFLDADDWISPVHIERLTNELISKPELDAVHCGSARVAIDGTHVVEQYLPPSGDMFPTLARRAAFPVHACIVRRSLVEAVATFDTSLRKSADWDLWQRVARTGARFGAVREVLAYYRMQPNASSLDAEQLFYDGLRVLKRGHSSDPRVKNPRSDHANGLPQEQIQSQEFYLLCWCAGLLLGCGKDARHLLGVVSDDHYTELYPNAIAQCIFEAATLPTCQPPSGWEQLWPRVQHNIEEFFVALERQSMTPELARNASTILRTMVLKHSPTWSAPIEELERSKALLEEDRSNWQLLAEERAQIIGEQKALVEDLRQSKALVEEEHRNWRRLAEERGHIIGEQTGLVEDLKQSKALLEEERSNWKRLAGERGQTIDEQEIRIGDLEQTRTALEQIKARLGQERGELQEQVRQRATERDELVRSYERRVGDLLLNRLRLRAPLLAIEQVRAAFRHRLTVLTLAGESRFLEARGRRRRVVATVCDTFPIYSQTFVYQELTELARQDFDLRLIYSNLDSRDYLHPQFAHLWKRKRRLFLNTRIHQKDFELYQKRMPEKVEGLIQKLCEASGLARHELIHHGNFLQAFSFTRMVEAYRPEYLHSYFFYDRSLMTLVAGYLLNIPRGITCYADHLLRDYELKVVPLHLELCNIVIATSDRIKQELLEIAPQTDPNRIVVKPNGIDTEAFPRIERFEPVEGAPFRLVSVCRIEPKKGLIDMVEAVSLLRQRGLQVEAHLVGTTDEWSQASRDYKRKLDQRISELNLWGTVHLEGRQNLKGVLRFLGLAQLFVAPFVETEAGDKDGIPTALLEGMATGLPAVATDAGSITEVIADGRDGVLVSERDPGALANAIEALLQNPERRARLGNKAAEKVRRRYDAKTCEKVFHERVRAIVEARRA